MNKFREMLSDYIVHLKMQNKLLSEQQELMVDQSLSYALTELKKALNELKIAILESLGGE